MSLVLSRYKEEAIRIGDDIRVTVIDVRGDKVRIAIDAPDSVSVHREEVWKAIKRHQRIVNPGKGVKRNGNQGI